MRRFLPRARLLVLAALLGCGTNSILAPAPSVDDAGTKGAADASLHDAGTDAKKDPHPLCVDGKSVDGAYPKKEYAIALDGTLPDLTFDALATDGTTTKVSLHEYFEPCAVSARLLVVRVSTGWCGTCRWTVAHTGELKKLDIGPRLTFLDLLVASDDNVPATKADLATFRARIDTPETVAADAEFSLHPLVPEASPLPLIVLVDTRTMTVKNFITNPDPQLVELRLRQELAALDGAIPPPYPVAEKFDHHFYRNQRDMIRDMALTRLGAGPPADTTNAKADDPAAAALGKQLFTDVSLSPSGKVACSTCHDPARQFADGLSQSTGVAKGDRNTPSATLASYARSQFWDGRAETLWAQALGPLENDKEHASSRLFVAHAIAARYATAYTAVFGALPPLADTARFPPAGKPGEAVYDAMASADKQAVTHVFANVGKSIAAFERTLRVKPNALDAYAGGDLTALTVAEKNGLFVFFTVGCAQCHYGPRMTDDAFHVLRFPTGRQDQKADRGRIDGVTSLLGSEFLANGPESDDHDAGHVLPIAIQPFALGAFKTPTLRGVAQTAPYGHGGALTTLADLTKLYATAGLPTTDPRAAGTVAPWLTNFDTNAAAALIPFLNVLTADVAP